MIRLLLLLCGALCAVETSGPGYRMKIEGEKSIHLAKRIAGPSPVGFYPGTDRREELKLFINGELYNRVKVSGEFQSTGANDEEAVLWLSCRGEKAGATRLFRQAKENYERAVRLRPDYEEARRSLQALQGLLR